MTPSLTNLTTVRLALVWKMRTCLDSTQQKQLWEQFSSSPDKWCFWCHLFQQYLCPCCFWVVPSGPRSPILKYFRDYAWLWKDKSKLTWSCMFPAMGVWKGCPIHQLVLPTCTFWGHAHWKLFPVRDLSTGMLLNSHMPLFRLNSFWGIHGKEVRCQLELMHQWLMISHMTLFGCCMKPLAHHPQELHGK